jgi:hypothetical protein
MTNERLFNCPVRPNMANLVWLMGKERLSYERALYLAELFSFDEKDERSRLEGANATVGS